MPATAPRAWSVSDRRYPARPSARAEYRQRAVFGRLWSVAEYLLLGPHNLISPQYLELVDSPCYLTAVINVDYVGKCIARFIRSLDVPRRRTEAPGASGESTPSAVDVLDLHLVGFSLGGQTAAFVANHLRPDSLLDRISGEWS